MNPGASTGVSNFLQSSTKNTASSSPKKDQILKVRDPLPPVNSQAADQ
jgi:hypothetical protein